jgi:UDP-N-acetyl-D-mannosaminuronate dehydrogenase
MRDSPSLAILPRLAAAGAAIRAFDPAGIDEARNLMPDLVYCDDAYEAAEGADALVLLTEWNEFRALDLAHIGRLLVEPLVIDLRALAVVRDNARALSASTHRPRAPRYADLGGATASCWHGGVDGCRSIRRGSATLWLRN